MESPTDILYQPIKTYKIKSVLDTIKILLWRDRDLQSHL